MSAAPIHVIQRPDSAVAMLHPLRQEILGRLVEPDSATGLSKQMGIPRQKLNYHLRQLEAEGLVELVEERKKRNFTERIVQAVARSYVISPTTLGALASDPDHIRDHASSAYLVAVATRIVQEVAELRQAAAEVEKRLPTLTIQTEVRFESAAKQSAFAQELTETLGTLVAKYHNETSAKGRSFRLVAGSYPKPKVPAAAS